MLVAGTFQSAPGRLGYLTGQIWLGNNGQDFWETAHLVRRGENYGWSVYEGSHPFYLNRKLGPTPVVLPTIEHSHSEARSLTGGVVYYGHELSELAGVYVYGDFSTGEVWGTHHDGKRVTWQQELASTELQITAFAVDQRGQLLIADYAGSIFRLIHAPRQTSTAKLPTRLSETGLFLSTKAHQVQPGVIPYSVNAPGWADGASAERFIAVPGDTRIGYASAGGWNFTNGVGPDAFARARGRQPGLTPADRDPAARPSEWAMGWILLSLERSAIRRDADPEN